MKWFGFGKTDDTPAPKQIHLGQSGGFRYDPIKKKYIFDGDSEEVDKAVNAPPVGPSAFKAERAKGSAARYADPFGTSSFEPGSYKPSNQDVPMQSQEPLDNQAEGPEVQPTDSQLLLRLEPEDSYPENDASDIDGRIEPLIRTAIDDDDLRQAKAELEELRRNYSLLKVSYHDTVYRFEADIEQQRMRAEMLSEMKSHTDAEVARLKFELDSEQGERQLLEEKLRKATLEPVSFVPSLSLSDGLTEQEAEHDILLRGAGSELENLQLKSTLNRSQERIAKLTGEIDNLRMRIDLSSKDLLLTTSYKNDELSRLNDLYATTNAELARSKAESKQHYWALQALRAESDGCELKVSLMSEAKIRAEIEMKKVLFDKTQLELEYEAVLQKLRHEDAEKNRLVDELLTLKYAQAGRTVDDEKLSLQRAIQEADMERLSMQRSNLEYSQEVNALVAKLHRIEAKAAHFESEMHALKELLQIRALDLEHIEQDLKLKTESFEAASNDLAKSRRVLEESTGQIEILQQQVHGHAQEKLEWDHEKTERSTELDELRCQLRKAEEELDAMAKLNEEVQGLHQRLAENDDSILQLEGQLTESNSARTQLEQDLADRDRAVLEADGKLADKDAEIQRLEQELTGNVEAVVRLEQQLAESQTIISKYEAEFSSSETNLTDALLEHKAAEMLLREELAKLSEELRNANSNIDSLKAEAEQQAYDNANELEILEHQHQADIEEEQTKYAALINSHRIEVASLETANQELQRQVKHASEAGESELLDTITRLDSQNSSLVKQLESAKEKLAALQQEHSYLKNEKAQTARELNEVRIKSEQGESLQSDLNRSLRSRAEALEEELAIAKQQAELQFAAKLQHDNAIKTLQEQLSKANANLADLNATIEDMKLTNQAREDTFMQNYEELTDDLQQLQLQHTKKQKECDDLRVKLSELQTALTYERSQLTDFANEQLTDLEHKCAIQEKELSEFASQVKTLDNEKKKLLKTLGLKEDELRNMQQRLGEADVSSRTLKESARQLSEEVEGLYEKNFLLEQQTAALKRLEEETRRLRAELELQPSVSNVKTRDNQVQTESLVEETFEEVEASGLKHAYMTKSVDRENESLQEASQLRPNDRAVAGLASAPEEDDYGSYMQEVEVDDEEEEVEEEQQGGWLTGFLGAIFLTEAERKGR